MEFNFLHPKGFLRFNYGNTELFNEFDFPIHSYQSVSDGILLVGANGPDTSYVIENDLSPYLVFNRGTFYSAPPADLILLGRAFYTSIDLPLIGRSLVMLGLEGYVDVGPVDGFQVWIQFEKESDYAFVFEKRRVELSNEGFMLLIKWVPNLPFYLDSPVCPIWILFFVIPEYLANLDDILDLSTRFGRPLWVNLQPCINVVAKVLVEMDVSLSLSSVFYSNRNGCNAWIRVGFVRVPDFCSVCQKFFSHRANCARRRYGFGTPSSHGLEVNGAVIDLDLDGEISASAHCNFEEELEDVLERFEITDD